MQCIWVKSDEFENWPFPSSPGSLYQNEVECSAFDMEIIFHSHANKIHFHKKGCALGFILKVKVFGTRKWPIRLTRYISLKSWLCYCSLASLAPQQLKLRPVSNVVLLPCRIKFDFSTAFEIKPCYCRVARQACWTQLMNYEYIRIHLKVC